MNEIIYLEPWLRNDEVKFTDNKDQINSEELIQQITKPGLVYDVVYNLFFHESPDYVNDFIRNAYKFNKNNNYLII